MPASKTRFIKKWGGPFPRENIGDISQRNTRGIYALQKKIQKSRNRPAKYNVVYIGMAYGPNRGSIYTRLRRHNKGKEGKDEWTHFSVFEVYDNILAEEIKEFEAIIRALYAEDRYANGLNRQKYSTKLKGARIKKLSDWKKRS